MAVSVWAMDIDCETAPVPSAHHNIPRFIAPPASVPTNPVPSNPAPTKPTQTLRVDIPPSVTDTTGIAGSSAASVHDPPPLVRSPTSPSRDRTQRRQRFSVRLKQERSLFLTSSRSGATKG
jgi:hypothetical protein